MKLSLHRWIGFGWDVITQFRLEMFSSKYHVVITCQMVQLRLGFLDVRLKKTIPQETEVIEELKLHTDVPRRQGVLK